jgi:hypothetical protein
MDNKTIIETFNILSQLDGERGMPVKFEYALCKIRSCLEPTVKALQTIQTAPIDGQAEYDEAKLAILTKMAEKDENGQPITQQTPSGMEYAIRNRVELAERISELNDEYSVLIKELKARQLDMESLLEMEDNEFNPYLVHVRYLPVKDGLCTLTVQQLRYLMPFLDGDIEELPDTADE